MRTLGHCSFVGRLQQHVTMKLGTATAYIISLTNDFRVEGIMIPL